ncbi:hypothetical protein HDV05_007061 [Chytridiales sp. JEL 0842]|nr:hypothetical protein HDV05_007061 [Chytridiales sp. JEL 0842]
MAVDALIVIPALGGIIATVQGAISAKMGAIAGDGFSSMLTVLCSSALGAVVWGIFEATGQGADFGAGMRVFSSGFVIVMVVCTGRLGAAKFTVVSVLFQLASAILFDNFAVGVPERKATVGRLMGLLVGILGMVLMNSEGIWASWKARKSERRRLEMTLNKRVVPQPSEPVLTSVVTVETLNDTNQESKSLQKSPENTPNLSSSSDRTLPKKESLLSTIFDPAILLVALSGISLSLQAGMNSTLGIAYKSAAFGTFVALVECIPLIALFFLAVQTKSFIESFSAASLRATAKEAPWWAWIGGFLGCGFILAITFLSGRLGVAPFLGTAVSFQMVSAVVVDHFGWLGLPVRKANVWRCGGAFLLVLGAIGMIVL